MTTNAMHKNYINGAFIDTPCDATIEVINPANGASLSVIPNSSADVINTAVAAAKSAQTEWAAKPAIERAQYLRQIATKLRERKDHFARVISAEQGKVLPLAETEVSFTADYLDYMAEWARRIEGEVITSDRVNETIMLQRKPIGVIGGILPWNFPLLLIARKLGPALVTGNCIVIKPSEETPNNAYEFAKLVAETDLPAGVFNLVFGSGATGAALCDNPDVGMVSFTGSVETGKRIMQACAKNITKVNLELGGKAPAIVTSKANIDLAAKAIRDSRTINTGQACNCAERVYVERSVADEFLQKLTQAMSETRFGDPLADQDISMGPLVNKQGLDKVAAMVEAAKEQGAQILCGGSVAKNTEGFHYLPTVMVVDDNTQAIMQKEIFGPVLPVMIVDSLDQALAYANDSEYGLTSSIFSQDADEIMKACRLLKFGETYVNREHFEAMQGFHAGNRKSGIGGADGKHGFYEYTETHVIYWQSH
ncbi:MULTISPECIES: aldehyde dehydrogenase [Pseudomonas]|uniref:aldehyde dehydrogenase n=1 Tax=Pseudomonas sp. MS19 TaxID=2579939 RepID=UPI000854DA5D|nr:MULTISPECIES: aldehyde dehydrogenase [Pseudomonas]NRH26452.1 aldehyde dehydrogenase [Pseudomonas sp. MS19]OEO24776.1 aldehyde dehydrogenase [Pseudomonas sp. J237]